MHEELSRPVHPSPLKVWLIKQEHRAAVGVPKDICIIGAASVHHQSHGWLIG